MTTDTIELEHRFAAWSRNLATTIAALCPAGVRTDFHTHLGIDSGSGLEMTSEALERQLSMAGVERALLIPLNASDGYHRTSMRLIEHAATSGGRHRALYRLDPRDPQLAQNTAAGLDAGAIGVKLHPVSDDCFPLDPRVAGALEAAQERRAVVLVHTGVDVRSAALEVIEAARRYPGARFVLGHVPAEALGQVCEQAAELDNVWTCLSWWGALDVSHVLQATRVDRIVFGSDPPYGNVVTGLAQTVLTARALGMDDEDLAAVLGSNAEVLMDGLDTTPRRTEGPGAPDRIDLLANATFEFRRCYLSLLPAVATGWRGGDPSAYFDFATCALELDRIDDELQPAAHAVLESIDLARSLLAGGMSEQAYAVGTAALTQTLCAPVLPASDSGAQFTPVAVQSS